MPVGVGCLLYAATHPARKACPDTCVWQGVCAAAHAHAVDLPRWSACVLHLMIYFCLLVCWARCMTMMHIRRVVGSSSGCQCMYVWLRPHGGLLQHNMAAGCGHFAAWFVYTILENLGR